MCSLVECTNDNGADNEDNYDDGRGDGDESDNLHNDDNDHG